MSIEIIDNGHDNKVEISHDVLMRGDGRIVMSGNNNQIRILDTNYRFGGYLSFDGGAIFFAGENVNASQIFFHGTSGSRVKIGNRCSFNGQIRFLLHEAKEIKIGDDCLFASDVDVTISDMHSILDKDTGKRINDAKSIRIGNKVWVGERCILLKGSEVDDGSIIGAGSVLSKKIPKNCVAAGNPVKIIRTNVIWDHRLL